MAIKLGVLISGSGTNLQAIIDRIEEGTLDATVEIVVSSRADAYGLKRAERHGIQTLTLSKETYDDPWWPTRSSPSSSRTTASSTSLWQATCAWCMRRSWRASPTAS